MSIVSEAVDQLSSLEDLCSEWDELAVTAAQPCSSPAWMLGWWRYLHPDGAGLNVVAVREEERLIGLAPLWRMERGRSEGAGGHLDFLAGGSFSSSVALLSAPGRAREVGAAVGAALSGSDLPPESIDVGPAVAGAEWPEALRAGWGGRRRPLLLRAEAISSPVINLGGFEDFDAWLAARGRSFRSNFRRRSRRLEKEGGTFRQSTAATVDEDIGTFVRLHRERWRDRGSSRMVEMGDRLALFLADLARDLGTEDRFRLHLLELDGKPVAAAFYVAAGGEVALINTGWEDSHHQLAPLQLLQGFAVSDGLARGDRRINLGRGANRAKLSVADGDEPVVEAIMLPSGADLPAALLHRRRFVRRCAQERVRAVMPEEAYDRLRQLKRRLRGSPAQPAPE
jgi:CelD/BcsL family acetyltransferase involved in cellulose biosynthesis